MTATTVKAPSINAEVMDLIRSFTPPPGGNSFKARVIADMVIDELNNRNQLVEFLLHNHEEFVRVWVGSRWRDERTTGRKGSRTGKNSGDNLYYTNEVFGDDNSRLRLCDMNGDQILAVAARKMKGARALQTEAIFLKTVGEKCKKAGKLLRELYTREQFNTIYYSFTNKEAPEEWF